MGPVGDDAALSPRSRYIPAGSMEATLSITRINHFEAAEGKAEELRQFLKGVITVVQSVDGCLGCRLLQDPEQPRRLAIVEVWDSVAAHQAAAQAIPHGEIAKVLPLLASQPMGNYYKDVA
jgi:quinol monooxygenase YgiN